MDILIIGGTRFVGRALSEAALTRGHNLTLFHRGETNPDIFPDAERIQGDRDGDIDKLAGREWDIVIDTCGYVPRVVELSVAQLQDSVTRYVFISTISVLADSDDTGRDETSALASMPDDINDDTEEVNGETYGPLKVMCEEVVETHFPERALIIRPGLITGPHDPTNRFTYWPRRIRKGGEVLAPGNPAYPVQHIDVRDLAEWTIQLCEERVTGIYHATGPAEPLTLGEWFETCKEISGSDAEFTWVTDDVLLEHDVQPFREVPFWLPHQQLEPLMTIDISKAMKHGLRFRPLGQTVRDTLHWVDNTEEPPGDAGLSPEREQAILEAYHAQTDDTSG